MLILMYHRVATPAADPFGLAMHPDRFAQQVDHLRSLGCVVPLLDWFRPGHGHRIAITFDDGYVDNATTAAPALEAAGLPVTWFLTSDPVGGGRFWWDELTHALLHGTTGPSLTVTAGGRSLWLDVGTARARRQALIAVRRRLKPLAADDLLAEVAQIALACAAPPADEADRAMSADQARELAGREGAEIGAHTRTHAQLGGQPPAVQRDEVLGSVTAVSELVGRDVRCFAYPFGDPAAVGDLAPDLVAESGCFLACSTSPGLAVRAADPFRLPRLNVDPGWGIEEFAGRVASVLSGGR